MDEVTAIDETVSALRASFGDPPEVAIVLGSGLSPFAERLTDATSVEYDELPHWPASGIVGHRGSLVVGALGARRVAVMAGRVHLYEGWSAADVVRPIRALGRWGARWVIVTNASGGIAPRLQPGDLMLVTDHLNLQGDNPLLGANDERLGPRFPDMSQAYDAALRETTRAAAGRLGIELKEGIYAAMKGPSYETPAEVRMVQTLGADAVGMSTVPEVLAARHMGMPVLGISCVTNRAAGLSETPLSHDEVTETVERVRGLFESLLADVIEQATVPTDSSAGADANGR